MEKNQVRLTYLITHPGIVITELVPSFVPPLTLLGPGQGKYGFSPMLPELNQTNPALCTVVLLEEEPRNVPEYPAQAGLYIPEVDVETFESALQSFFPKRLWQPDIFHQSQTELIR